MKLKSVTLKNFRAYSDETTISIDSCLTGITGKNDAGKSTILEALDVFLDGGEIALEKDDFNVRGGNQPIEITCEFDNLPATIVLDDASSTTLQDEYLVTEEGTLRIRKTYKQSSLKKPVIEIIAKHPTGAEISALHKLKISDLKGLAQKLGVEEADIEDGRVSSNWRQAIWNSQELAFEVRPLDVGTDLAGTKDVFSAIEQQLPVFALFRSDRESKDNDPHAKNPLQAAVKSAQAELRAEIDALEAKIRQQVIERAKKTIEKLKEMAPEIADELNPRFKSPPKWTFDFSLDGDDGIPINKRGSGVRRLILLNFFRAEAERRANENSGRNVIYAIEEPETSQHPSNQEMLIRTLIQLSYRSECQVLLTTHVPALAGLLPIEGLRFVDSENGTVVVKEGSDTVFQAIANSLGVLPEPIGAKARALVLVEGVGDKTFLEHAGIELHSAGFLSATLESKEIRILPIGGCGNLKHWITMKMAEQFNIPFGILLDSDKGTPEETKNIEAVAKHVGGETPCFLTRKREPENYIARVVVQTELAAGTVLPEYSDTCDAKKIIARACTIRDVVVIDRFWTKMSAQQIRNAERYVDEAGTERFELTEVIERFLALVD